jgi:hypothetical protein
VSGAVKSIQAQPGEEGIAARGHTQPLPGGGERGRESAGMVDMKVILSRKQSWCLQRRTHMASDIREFENSRPVGADRNDAIVPCGDAMTWNS